MNIKINISKIPLILSVVFFLVSLFLFLFFYWMVSKNNQESQLKEEVWQNEVLKREEMKTLGNSLETIKKEVVDLETHFAQNSDIVPFLNTIEGLASKVGAKAEVSSVDVAADKSGLLVGMKASGTFGSLYRFLTLLENSSYELDFIEVSLNREGEGEKESKGTALPKWGGIFKIKLLSFI